MMLEDLADACRKSGLEVIETPGWKTRGHGELMSVETIVPHHTATPRTVAGDYPSLGIVRDGRADLPGPLAQLGLSRSGEVYVIAAGVAYHAGTTFLSRQDNWHAIGIEAEHDGFSPWPRPQYDAYVRLCAALARHYGVPVMSVQGHKEIAAPAGRKIDPTFDMTVFRADVNRLLAEEDRRAEMARDLNDAMVPTKRAERKSKGRPRLAFWTRKARQALRRARQINRGD